METIAQFRSLRIRLHTFPNGPSWIQIDDPQLALLSDGHDRCVGPVRFAQVSLRLFEQAKVFSGGGR
jgi:hypothetical protein